MIIPVNVVLKWDEKLIENIAIEYLTAGPDQYGGDLERDIPLVVGALRTGQLVVDFDEENASVSVVAYEEILKNNKVT